MISVFVCKDSADLKGWHWNAGPQNTDTLRDEASAYQYDGRPGKTLICHVRSKPTPSMVLNPGKNESVQDVQNFIDYIKDDSVDKFSSDAMRQFIGAMREAIGICTEVKDLQDAPLCVFIHFGGEDYKKYNTRLREAWEGLQTDVKSKFLCFAITRGGTSGDIINQAWLGNDNELNLPDTNEQLVEVLRNACKDVWGIGLPDPFAKADAVPTLPPDKPGKRPPQSNEAIGGGNPPSANGKNDDSAKSKSDEDQGNQVKIRLNAKSACVLKWIVATEVFAGFVMSWVKSFFTHSFAGEFCFGVLGLVFLIIPVVLLWNAHEEDSPTQHDTNNDLKKALGLSDEADEAEVLKTAKDLKSSVDKQRDKDRNAEAEQFASENAIKADKAALKKAYTMSPEAAKALVAGISVPQAAPEQDNS